FAKFGKDNRQAVSASLRYFNLGDIQYTDIEGENVGQGKHREFSLDVGYSRKLSDYLSVVVGLRYIHSSLLTVNLNGNITDYKPGKTFAADVGVYYTKTNQVDEFRSNTLSLGATITNLGGKVAYNEQRKDFLPINLGLGAAYNVKLDEYNQVTFALD